MLNIFQFLIHWKALHIVLASVHMNRFAVNIAGGDAAAEIIALKYGFLNLGQIGSLQDYYLFEHQNIEKRSLHHNPQLLDVLQNETNVLWCEQQVVKKRVKRQIIQEPLPFPDPLYPEQWFLHGGAYGGYDMNVIPAWKEGFTGKGVVVSILDDGIQTDHPDLAQNYDRNASWDINDADDDPTPKDDDDNSHGTRCAGEVAAVANNDFCGVGIAYNSSIGGLRMLDGDVTDSTEAAALSHNRNHIHIYSASWGPEDDGKTVDGPGKLAKSAFEDGVIKGRDGLGSIFVWASGNGGGSKDSCNCDGYTNSIFTISISSATQSGLRPWYLEECSSTLATTYSSGIANQDQDIVTVDSYLSYLKDLERGKPPNLSRLCTKSHTGTSASAPIAAGICALALQANPMLTWRDMQYLIVMTSNYKPLSQEDGWIMNANGRNVSSKFGYGLMNAHAMVKLAKKWKTLPRQHICSTAYDATERIIPETPGEKLVTSINTTGCKYTQNAIQYLEHVQIIATLSYRPRGNLHIVLISPSGTQSDILLPRPQDKRSGRFTDWPFMSVHFFGENPEGNWKLLILNDGNLKVKGPGTLTNWSLTFYGTETKPLSLRVLEKSRVKGMYKEEIQRSFLTHEMSKNGLRLNKCSGLKQFHFAVENKSFCTSKCPVGHYGDFNDYSCHLCDNSCLSCYGPSYNNCLSCSKYYLFNNSCIKSCPQGFFPDADKHLCSPCPSFCLSCESKKLCNICKAEYIFHENNCLASCPSGTFPRQQNCEYCHNSCTTCYGPHSTDCITCPSPYFFHNNTCILKCPAHFYVNDDYTCARCHRSCEYCSDKNSCLKCRTEWGVDTATCAYNSRCSNGWYNEDSDSCEACYKGCTWCSGPNYQDCVYCDSRFKLFEGYCVSNCPDGTYLYDDECRQCNKECFKCDQADTCLVCNDGFVVHEGKCYPYCPLGYFKSGKACEVCHSECLHCSGSLNSNCISCSQGFYLVDSTCQPKCPEGYYSSNSLNNECLPCYSTCKTCLDFGPTNCLDCHTNSFYLDGACLPCLDNEFYNSLNKSCERCHDNCGQCFGPKEINCLSCTIPLRLDEVKHICLPCCHSSTTDTSHCCTCSKDLDVCVNSEHPRSISINISPLQTYEVVIPMNHVIPIVVAICSSAILLYGIVFGLLHAKYMGWFNVKFRFRKYERVPHCIETQFDAEMENISLIQEDEDDIYEKTQA